MKSLDKRVVDKVNSRNKPTKKRVTFFLDIKVKEALAAWCAENDISESAAVEGMLEEMIPKHFLKK